MDGLTGKIKFDSRGLRTDFELEIVELKKDGRATSAARGRPPPTPLTRPPKKPTALPASTAKKLPKIAAPVPINAANAPAMAAFGPR